MNNQNLHPYASCNDKTTGEKDVYYGSRVYLEGEDAENLKPGEKITMINWGNMLVDHISRSDNKVCLVELSLQRMIT